MRSTELLVSSNALEELSPLQELQAQAVVFNALSERSHYPRGLRIAWNAHQEPFM